MEDEFEVRGSVTYELRIVFDQTSDESVLRKEAVKEWLTTHGVESFVEGAVDSLDIEHDYDVVEDNRYYALGGDRSPISIYKYDLSWLTQLKQELANAFPGFFVLEQYEHDTKQWTEGWKESFRPFATELFYVRPPWEVANTDPERHELIIDPGMAFGTGQHATTQLCLRVTEQLVKEGVLPGTGLRLLDVGTGSGILAIAAKKIGVETVWGSDIDPDSILSAKNNATDNEVEFEVRQASVLPCEGGWNFMYANILSVVLKRIMGDLYKHLAPEGRVLMSGLIKEEEEEMKSLAREHGFAVSETFEMDGWLALVLQK